MLQSIRSGISFGLTSGVITTLGLLIGLGSGTGSKPIVIGAILTIAIADSLSDALGVHMVEEVDKNSENKSVWMSTATTFLTKFLITTSFLVPIIFFDLIVGMIVCVIWGVLLLTLLSFFVARRRGDRVIMAVLEHLVIAFLVVIATRFVGDFIAANIG